MPANEHLLRRVAERKNHMLLKALRRHSTSTHLDTSHSTFSPYVLLRIEICLVKMCCGVVQAKDWQKQPLPTESKCVLSGHQDGISCLCADADQGIVVSASHSGKCILHLLSKCTYIRTILHPVPGAPIELLTLAKGGEIAMYSSADRRLHLFDINGNYLLGCDAGPNKLTCMRLCLGGCAILTGDAGGQVRRAPGARMSVNLCMRV
jgi:hypothetical protein